MQTKPKSNSVITSLFDFDAGTITYTVRGIGDLVLDLKKIHPDNITHASFHGFNQRLPDAAAISAPEFRVEMTAEEKAVMVQARNQEKYNNMVAIRDHYESGSPDWKLSGVGGGGETSLTIRAIGRVMNVDYSIAKGYVERFAGDKYAGDSKKALAFLRSGKRVAEAILAIRAESMPEARVEADNAIEELIAGE